MRRGWAFVLGALLAVLPGCSGERHAGTEVGNPEMVRVSAIFASFDTTGEILLEDMHMLAMGMTYQLARPGQPLDTDTCWVDPAGTLVNTSGFDFEDVLPDTVVPDGEWVRAELTLRAPEGSAPLPVIEDFETWNHPRYAKFHLARGANSLSGIFEMPQEMEFSLIYGRETIETVWRWEDGTMWPLFRFDAGTWLKGLDAGRSYATRRDGKRVPYVVFSPTENAAAWAALRDSLPGAFEADTLRVR